MRMNLSVALNEISSTLIVSGEESSDHDEVRSGSERLGDVSRVGTSSVAHHVSVESVSSVGALQNRTELRVADSSLLAGGAHGSWSDSNLDDVGARNDELLDHLSGNDVSGHDCVLRVSFTDAANEVDERLGVTVGNIQTNVLQLRKLFNDSIEFRPIVIRDSRRDGQVVEGLRGCRRCEGLPLIYLETKDLNPGESMKS